MSDKAGRNNERFCCPDQLPLLSLKTRFSYTFITHALLVCYFTGTLKTLLATRFQLACLQQLYQSLVLIY